MILFENEDFQVSIEPTINTNGNERFCLNINEISKVENPYACNLWDDTLTKVDMDVMIQTLTNVRNYFNGIFTSC